MNDVTPDPIAYGPSDAELIEHARTVGMVDPERAPEFVAAYRAHVEQQSTLHATPPVPQLADVEEQRRAAETDPGERYPTLLSVYCDSDTCDIEWRGEFLVSDTMTKADRLDVVRRCVRSLGWQCDPAGDFCPDCEPSAPTAAQAAPVTLPYVHTDCDGDTLTVRPALGLDAPTLIITAGNSADHEQYATLVPVDEVPALVAAITRAAAVARRDDDADQAAPLHAAGRMAAEGLARGITQTKAERDHPPGDLFTEAAISRSALLAGADAIEALPQDFECDPGRGDAVKLLRRLADHYATAEQPTGPTWQARTDHAVRLYAMTAIERDDARAENARLRTQLADAVEGWRQAEARTDREHALAALKKQQATEKQPEPVGATATEADTVESLLEEIADDIPHRRAHAIAADYLARYTRLLAATAHAHSSQRGTEMRAEGYRGRAAWCSGMREIARQLDARADAIAEAGR
ncbi:hypothetical protein [Streptomyces sp. DT171]|uniref:hypothetical protein n=1 Tax=Streptomyces sp. DT171 TaxID=3416524 RepID=UPI003CF36B41